jgi:hemolysin activation/secretion protein
LAVFRFFCFAFLLLGIAPAHSQVDASGIARVGDLSARIEGVTMYDPDTLLKFAIQHVEGHDGLVTADRVVQALDLIYREDGYFLAESTVDVDSDGLVFLVTEGWIERLAIEGADHDLFEQIAAYFEPVIGLKPLTLHQFERAMMLTDDLSGVSIAVEIDYPSGSEGARLYVFVAQQTSGGSVTLDNPPREFGSGLTALAKQEFYSTLKPGDLLRLEAGGSAFVEDGSGLLGGVAYRTPIGGSGSYIEGYAKNVYAQRDGSGQLSETTIRGLSTGLIAGYPVVRDLHRHHYLLLEARHSQVDSITSLEDFESAAQTISATYLMGYRTSDGSPSHASLTLAAGTTDDDLASTGERVDPEFWYLRAGLGVARHLPAIHPDTAVRAEIWGQFSTSHLPSVEDFYLGDKEAVRGYAFAEGLGDMGAAATIEFSHHFSLGEGWVYSLTPFAFVDMGVVEATDDTVGLGPKTLASVGLGTQATFAENISLSGWVGVPLKDGRLTDQYSPGAYLRLSKAW